MSRVFACAGRILGMGDVLSLVEKVEGAIKEEEAEKMKQKMMSAKFDYNDFLTQFEMINKMGPMNQVMKLMPGMSKISDKQMYAAEKKFSVRLCPRCNCCSPPLRVNPLVTISARVNKGFLAARLTDTGGLWPPLTTAPCLAASQEYAAMIGAMEPEERENPDLIAKSPSRRRRIAKDAEMKEDSVVEMISTFASMRSPRLCNAVPSLTLLDLSMQETVPLQVKK